MITHTRLPSFSFLNSPTRLSGKEERRARRTFPYRGSRRLLEQQLPGSASSPSGPMQVCVCRHQNRPSLQAGTVGSASARMNCPFQRKAVEQSVRCDRYQSDRLRRLISRHLRVRFQGGRASAPTLASCTLYLVTAQRRGAPQSGCRQPSARFPRSPAVPGWPARLPVKARDGRDVSQHDPGRLHLGAAHLERDGGECEWPVERFLLADFVVRSLHARCRRESPSSVMTSFGRRSCSRSASVLGTTENFSSGSSRFPFGPSIRTMAP